MTLNLSLTATPQTDFLAVPIFNEHQTPAKLRSLRRATEPDALLVDLHIDDGGYDCDSVEAIKALTAAQRLVSFSVLANAQELDVLAAWYKALPPNERPEVFLHFNLVEGRPTRAAQTRLVKGQHFHSKAALIRRCLRGAVGQDEVEAELRAQLTDVRQRGFTIVGVDSHQHMHALAPVSNAVLEVAGTERLMVRSLSRFRAVTSIGRVKLALFRMICRLTELATFHRLRLPAMWQQDSWEAYVVGSWEKITMSTAPEGAVLVCHPALTHDRLTIF